MLPNSEKDIRFAGAYPLPQLQSCYTVVREIFAYNNFHVFIRCGKYFESLIFGHHCASEIFLTPKFPKLRYIALGIYHLYKEYVVFIHRVWVQYIQFRPNYSVMTKAHSGLGSPPHHGNPYCTLHCFSSHTTSQLQNIALFLPFAICHPKVNDLISKLSLVIILRN